MAENENQQVGENQVETPTAGKIKSMGKPQPASISQLTNPQSGQENNGQEVPNATQIQSGQVSDGGETNSKEKVKTNDNEPTKQPIDEASLKEFFKGQGIEFDSIEALKTKLNSTPQQQTPQEPTPEEKEKIQKEREQKVLTNYLAKGGKVEDFVSLTNLAKATKVEIAIGEITRDLKDQNFTDEEIQGIIKERYYQFSDEEIEELDDDDDKESYKRKRAYGSKQLENRAASIKKQAEDYLKILNDDVDALDNSAKHESEFSSKVDEHLKTLPKKITFELGEVNNKPIDPIDYEVVDTDITEIAETLKDPQKRKQYFFTDEGDLNLTNVAQLMLDNKILKSALKRVYLEGGTRQTKVLESVFPRQPHAIGLGGITPAGNTNKGQAGKLVGKGRPEVANRQK